MSNSTSNSHNLMNSSSNSHNANNSSNSHNVNINIHGGQVSFGTQPAMSQPAIGMPQPNPFSSPFSNLPIANPLSVFSNHYHNMAAPGRSGTLFHPYPSIAGGSPALETNTERERQRLDYCFRRCPGMRVIM